MFFHIQVLHILFNMLTLFWFGNFFRAELGNRRVLPMYLLAGIFGAAMYILFYWLLPQNNYLGGPLLAPPQLQWPSSSPAPPSCPTSRSASW